MPLKIEATLPCQHGLTFFNFRVVEFQDLAALQADQMVVMFALIEFEHRLPGFEVVAGQKPCLLELGENSVDSRQADVDLLADQQAMHVVCGHVVNGRPGLRLVKELEDLQPRQRCFEADAFQIVGIGLAGHKK